MIYQLHIRLLEVDPPIWRRIQVSGKIMLYRLNLFIQRAMGWENCHLSEFEINGKKYADSHFDEFGEGILEFKNYKVSKVLPDEGGKFIFTYDFGDDWRHEVTVEKMLTEEPGGVYPVCMEGERACPPEDVGGVIGYELYLEAISDPSHEEHKSLKQWRGEFDPEKFDKIETTKWMQKRT